MDKIDFKKSVRDLYTPVTSSFSIVDVPSMQFVKVDGQGRPAGEAYLAAIPWLYAISYSIKFSSKIDLGRDYVVPPLEALWWADDMSAFVNDDRDSWRWTAMIMAPEWATDDMFRAGLAKAQKKLETPPESLRFEPFAEGLSVQIMHIGPYADEAPTIARMHGEFIPEHGLTENGHHHEIYISDPQRTAPEKLKTVLRQPVRTT